MIIHHWRSRAPRIWRDIKRVWQIRLSRMVVSLRVTLLIQRGSTPRFFTRALPTQTPKTTFIHPSAELTYLTPRAYWQPSQTAVNLQLEPIFQAESKPCNLTMIPCHWTLSLQSKSWQTSPISNRNTFIANLIHSKIISANHLIKMKMMTISWQISCRRTIRRSSILWRPPRQPGIRLPMRPQVA